eukprot:3055203-Rhodomonas_salina.3
MPHTASPGSSIRQHTLGEYRTAHSSIRNLSTGQRIAPYWTTHSSICNLSTGQGVAAYARAVPDSAQQHPLC